jgi:hypothetical protein
MAAGRVEPFATAFCSSVSMSVVLTAWHVIDEFIASLPLDESARQKLRELNPRSYVGLAAKLVERFAPPAPKSGG